MCARRLLLSFRASACEEGDLVPKDAEALQVELRSSELFDFPPLSRTLVVQRNRDGLSADQTARAVRRTVDVNRGLLGGLERVAGALVISNSFGKPLFSRESSPTALTYLFFLSDVSQSDRRILAQRFIDRYVRPGYEGFAGSTGTIAARDAQAQQIEDSLPLVELATVLPVALVVGLHFGSVGAPLATLSPWHLPT